MPRLTVQMQMSIDGFVDSSVAGSRWSVWDWGPQWPWSADVREQFNGVLASAGGILLSRPMISEGYLDHWGRVADEHGDDPDYRFAVSIRQLPKYVVTARSVPATWPRTTVISGEFAESVQRAKDAAPGDLVCFGGAGFVSALLRSRLVDELQLYVNPGIAGEGASIFGADLGRERFELVDAIPTECGIIIARWRPDPASAEPS